MSTLQTLLVVVNDEHTDPMDAREELEGVTDFLRVQSLAKLERLEIETILPQPSDLCYLMETIAEQCPSLTKLKLCGRPADHDHGTGAETPAPPTFAKTLFPLLRVYSMTHLDITLPWRIAMGPSEAESAIQNWASLRTLRMTGADEACAREFESSKGVSLEALCILAVGMPSLEALVVDITTTTTEIDTVLKPDRRFMDGTWLAVKLENIGRTPTPGKFHEDGGATRTIEFLSESISSILSRDDNPTLDEQPDGGTRAITGKAAVLVELKAPSEEASGLINAFNEDW
ncbi:hypothetical protein FRB90_008656 [Tulasnella sp. 427]|nr:hypothetical protein FRB90_008656 [Tulasnella sp. 427]